MGNRFLVGYRWILQVTDSYCIHDAPGINYSCGINPRAIIGPHVYVEYTSARTVRCMNEIGISGGILGDDLELFLCGTMGPSD